MPEENDFSIISWNVNSLDAKRSSPKTSRKDVISIESWFDLTQPSIVAFQETYWTEKTEKLKLSVDYQHISAISDICGARSLSVFVHPDLVVVKDGKIGDDTLFCQWVETKVANLGHMVVVNIYLPHYSSLGNTNRPVRKLYSKLATKVQAWKKAGKRVLIVGDFNTHNSRMGGQPRPKIKSNKTRVRFENDFIDQNDLFYTVLDFPTRRRKGDRPGFIDHVISTHPDLVQHVEIGYTLNSKIGDDQFPDHNPVISRLSIPHTSFSPGNIKTPKWHNVSPESWKLICDELRSDQDTESFGPLVTPDQLASYMVKRVNQMRSKYVKSSTRKPTSKDFFDSELRNLRDSVKRLRRRVNRLRKRASRADDLLEAERDYKRLRCQYGKMYDRKQSEFLKALEKRTTESLDAKHLMTSLKRIAGEQYVKIPVIIPGDQTNPGKIPSTKTESLNNLATEFAQVGTNSTRSNQYSEKYYLNRDKTAIELLNLISSKTNLPDQNGFDILARLNEIDFLDIISNLKDTSSGPDEIPAIFLRNTPVWSTTMIRSIVLTSLMTGRVPTNFLKSNVTPIVKDPLKSLNFFTNWRPISLTSIVSRTCERVISLFLLKEVEHCGGLRNVQFGARKHMGTTEALTYALLGVKRVVAKHKVCHGVFLDVSKAFDRVDHFLLSRKLLDFGINPVLVRWILTFLVGRKMRVKVGGDASDWYTTLSGIPQGTVLGPLLWLIWINDCPIDLSEGLRPDTEADDRGSLFVDDIFIFSCGSERNQISDLNSRLSELYNWSNDWGVDFNISKTKHMRFGHTKNKYQLSFGGATLLTVSEYKYLGLLFTNKLSFDRHVLELALPKARRVAGHVSHILSKCKTGRCTFLRILWQSKISPILEYASGVWSSFVTQGTLDKVDRFQKEFFRKAMGLPSKTSGAALLCDFAVVRQSLRFEANRMKLRAKLDFGLVPAVVQRQRAAYCSTKFVTVKYFTAATRRECMESRDRWCTRNPHAVAPPRSETFDSYRLSLTEVDDSNPSHYRAVYRNGKCKSRPWRADLRIYSCPEFPHTRQDYQNLHNFLTKAQKKALKARVPFRSIVSRHRLVSQFLNGRNQILQWNDFTTTSPNHILATMRGGWYRDPLLTELKDPFMRLIRKARLGVSELASHTPYMSQSKDRTCFQCSSNAIESLHHFFFECDGFRQQRVDFLSAINPILDELALPRNKVASVLGFPTGTASKGYFKYHRELREKLYLETCKYMRLTQRFSFV